MKRLVMCLVVVLVGVAQVEAAIVSWGYDLYNQVTDTPSGTGFTAIAGGYSYSLALRSDAVVPEPSTLAALLSLALCGVGIGWYRRRKA